MGEYLVKSLKENGDKYEGIAEGALARVRGVDFAGGAGSPGEHMRALLVRETLEEFHRAFSPERFRRILPDPIWVRQFREGKMWDFSVVCFGLRVAEEEALMMMKEGVVLLDSPESLRIRDQYIHSMVERRI